MCEEKKSSAFLFLFWPAFYFRNVWNVSLVLTKVAGLTVTQGTGSGMKHYPCELRAPQPRTQQQLILLEKLAPASGPAAHICSGVCLLLHKACRTLPRKESCSSGGVSVSVPLLSLPARLPVVQRLRWEWDQDKQSCARMEWTCRLSCGSQFCWAKRIRISEVWCSVKRLTEQPSK